MNQHERIQIGVIQIESIPEIDEMDSLKHRPGSLRPGSPCDVKSFESAEIFGCQSTYHGDGSVFDNYSFQPLTESCDDVKNDDKECMNVVEIQLVEDDLDADGLVGHSVSIHGKPVPRDSKTPPDKVRCSGQSDWSDDDWSDHPRNSEWSGVSGDSYGSS